MPHPHHAGPKAYARHGTPSLLKLRISSLHTAAPKLLLSFYFLFLLLNIFSSFKGIQEDQGAHNWAHGAPLRRKARAFCALKGIRYCVSFTFLSHSLCLYDYHRLYAHVCISLSLGWSSIQMKANEFTVIRFRNLNVNWRL